MFNATYPLSFQLFQQKRWSRGRLNCISMLACKGPVCVAVLTNFYGRFFVEVGQFINSKSFHLGRHFCHLLTPPRFGEFNPESESSGSQQVYRKLFPRGPHSSKNNFFKIKISGPTPSDSLSVLLWFLTTYNTLSCKDILLFPDCIPYFFHLRADTDRRSFLIDPLPVKIQFLQNDDFFLSSSRSGRLLPP